MELPKEFVQKFKYKLEEIVADNDETPGPTVVMLRDILNMPRESVTQAAIETIHEFNEPPDSPLTDVLETWWESLNPVFAGMVY